MSGKIDVIIGAQMGDEGKGRFTNLLAGEAYHAVARFNGGANAGHTFEHDGQEINTHQIPSGITYTDRLNLVTNSSLVDPVALLEEIQALGEIGIPVNPANLAISSAARLVTPAHIAMDRARENGELSQGSTKRGISFVAAAKYGRTAVTAEAYFANTMGVSVQVRRDVLDLYGEDVVDGEIAHEKWIQAMHQLEPFFTDTVDIVHDILDGKRNILAEGAQSSGLDIEHGIHGEGTSSHVTVGGVLNSLGVGAQYIRDVYGVAKLLKSRVGGTPESFPTRIQDDLLAARIRGDRGAIDSEYGKSTGRPRMVGWLDLAELRQSQRVNGMTDLIVTKLDCLPNAGESIQIATHYVDEYGEKVLHTPTSLDRLKRLRPQYEELPTWKQDIQDIREFERLPGEAQDVINFISDLIDMPVSMIGVGPNKNQIIDRRTK